MSKQGMRRGRPTGFKPLEKNQDQVENSSTLEEIEEEGVMFTYVGAGEQSPERINFMGKQVFVRGTPVVIEDELLIEKLTGNPAFVEGVVDQRFIMDRDEEARLLTEKKRAEDMRINANFNKKHGGA